jgi:hypothetical protein
MSDGSQQVVAALVGPPRRTPTCKASHRRQYRTEVVYRRRAGEDVSLSDDEPVMSELSSRDPTDRGDRLDCSGLRSHCTQIRLGSILTRRASEGSAPEPSLARRVTAVYARIAHRSGWGPY